MDIQGSRRLWGSILKQHCSRSSEPEVRLPDKTSRSLPGKQPVPHNTIPGDNAFQTLIQPSMLKRSFSFLSQGVGDKPSEKYRFNSKIKEYRGHFVGLQD